MFEKIDQDGSSGKSVGEFRFGKFAHREKQCYFEDFIVPKAVGFSRNEIYFAIQALNNALGILLLRLEPIHDQRLMTA